MRQYKEEIDKTIIEILYQKGERTFKKLMEDVEKSIKHTLSFETYSYRLNAMSKPYDKDSRYAIYPVLNKIDEGRGKNVFYSLTRDAKIRYDLGLPMMKTETITEKAYRLLFYYIVFYYNQIKNLQTEDEYEKFLEELHINKNELRFLCKSNFKEFKITKWTHLESEIEITRKDVLNPSGKEGTYEYFCMLPGISATEFQQISEQGLPYHKLKITENEVNQSFRLLENQNLIKIIPYYLEFFNQERYIIVNDVLKELLANCWTLQSHVFTYLEYRWQSLSKPINEERIWYEHLWGKTRSKHWFIECNNIRREYQKTNKNQMLKETQERLDYEASKIKNKFNSIKNEYAQTIKDYSYFIIPLLNVVYPDFLRKEFNQNY